MQNVTVEGSGNQVLVVGGDFYQVNLNLPPPTAWDRQNLLNLLGQVRRKWIDSVLAHSIRRTELLGVRIQTVPGAVEAPWARELEAAGGLGAATRSVTEIGRVFDEACRTLLVLGEPGAGKSIALLTLAREYAERAQSDPAAPVPVVLNLTSWADSHLTIHDWIVGELGRQYYVSQKFARRWLEQNRLLLLLDGLDEVVALQRAACVAAIHVFVQEHGISGLAICCREREYRALPVRLRLGGAVSVLPLDQGQIDSFLDAAGPELAGLRTRWPITRSCTPWPSRR